jgi:hypothetical protein
MVDFKTQESARPGSAQALSPPSSVRGALAPGFPSDRLS